MYVKEKFEMSEPGAVANTITQSNNQGQIPYTYYPDLHVTATGTDRAPFDSTTGGVGLVEIVLFPLIKHKVQMVKRMN